MSDFSGRAILHHRQHIVLVIVVKNKIAAIVLPDVKIVCRSLTDVPLCKVLIYGGLIRAFDFFRILVIPLCFDVLLSKRIRHISQLE